jgi:7-keto-8-aminopelargonate synthetase-like enzyme
MTNEPAPLQQLERTRVLYQNRKLSYFAGCDYFRMASHPKVLRAVAEGLKKYGLNVAASRLTTGNHAIYAKLETALARFFAAPAALLVSNGYVTNSIVAQTLRNDFTHVLIDAKAHPSLRDASRFFSATILEFCNLDTEDLKRVLAAAGKGVKPILLTDGMFSGTGEIAPLAEYLKILGPSGLILLDDAHGAGVLGKMGRGTPELEKISRERIVQSITLSKAFGVYGGAILCSRALRERMVAGSPAFAGSTPLPLPLANAALYSVQILKQDKGMRRRLQRNVDYVKNSLRAAGYSVPHTAAPVLAINPVSPSHAKALRRQLLARGVFPSFIRYPGGPPDGYFRIALSSEHTRQQLDDLLAGLTSSRVG